MFAEQEREFNNTMAYSFLDPFSCKVSHLIHYNNVWYLRSSGNKVFFVLQITWKCQRGVVSNEDERVKSPKSIRLYSSQINLLWAYDSLGGSHMYFVIKFLSKGISNFINWCIPSSSSAYSDSGGSKMIQKINLSKL